MHGVALGLLGNIHRQSHLRHFQDTGIYRVASPALEPLKHLGEMPDRGATFVNRNGKRRSVGKHQLAHCLSGNTHNIRHIGQTHQVRRSLDKTCRRHGALDVGQGRAHRLFGTVCFPGKFQRQAPRLTDTHQSIITTRSAKALHQGIRVAVVVSQWYFSVKIYSKAQSSDSDSPRRPHFNSPALPFRVPDRGFNLLFRVRWTSHSLPPVWERPLIVVN